MGYVHEILAGLWTAKDTHLGGHMEGMDASFVGM